MCNATKPDQITQVRWEVCKNDFKWDGSLRDVYISPATLNEWRALYSFLREVPAIEYSVDGIIRPLPDKIEQAFSVRPAGSPMLRVRVGRAFISFHFFSTGEIECDIDPREVSSQSELDSLLGFMQQMGEATKRLVVITPENTRCQPIISYSPDVKEFQYHDITA